MEDFLSSAVVWFGIGFLFFLLEFLLPGFILFFFGIGAWLVAVLLLFTDVSLNTQLLVFLLTSIASVFLFRNWAKAKLGMDKANKVNLEDEYVGKIALAETFIGPEVIGKVEFKGTSWDARSEDTILAGEQVRIVRTESILLIVKSNKHI